MTDLTLFCLVQGNAISQAFPLSINSNENIGQLKKAIKTKKIPEFNFFDVDRLKIWKVQIRADNDKELNKLTLHNNDQLLAGRKISSYFTDKPLDKHIHIVVKPPKLIHFSLELVLEAGLLNERESVEYLSGDRIYKATLRESCLCTEDGKYFSFIEFIRVARRLKSDETPAPYDFQNLRINNITYQEVRDKIYKFVPYKYEDSLFIDHFSIPWGDDLENRLRHLHSEKDVLEIFWGRNLKDDDTTWRVYVVFRDISCLHKRTESVMEDQMIRFITVGEGFANTEIRRLANAEIQQQQSSHHSLSTLKKVPKELRKAFDEALDNELGQSFREMHYNLVGMSTGYKRTQGRLTEIPAIILYVRQKGILRRGCDIFPDKICGYPVDVVEACVATPYGHGVSACQAYQKDVGLGSSIGITESQGTSGTLSAVVRDKNSKEKIGILSCEHVCRFSESSTGMGVIIHQPSHKDLDNLIKSFVDMASEDPTFENISANAINNINNNRQNSAIARYVSGMRSNYFSEVHQKNFGIDAAFCIFEGSNRTLNPNRFTIPQEYFEKENLPGNTRLNGFYTYKEFNNVDEIDVFKVGRTTGLTLGKLLPNYTAISIDLTKKSIEANQDEVPVPPHNNNDYEKMFIGYMKSPLIQEINKMRQKCYPAVWFDRQLAFKFKHGDFEPGDSGASVVDKEGKALGILHAAWMTEDLRYAIASPYFAVFEALNVVEY